MGLDISHTQEGFKRGYWGRMKFGAVDYDSKYGEVFLRGYIDKASQASNQSTLADRFEFMGADFDDIFDKANTNKLNQNAQERAYVKIKTLTTSELGLDWTTAVDNK